LRIRERAKETREGGYTIEVFVDFQFILASKHWFLGGVGMENSTAPFETTPYPYSRLKSSNHTVVYASSATNDSPREQGAIHTHYAYPRKKAGDFDQSGSISSW